MRRTTLLLMLLYAALQGAGGQRAAALTIEPLAPTGVTRTAAWLCGNLTATNGTTNPITLRLCYGTSDGSTNFASWGNTNLWFPASATGAVSTNVAGLVPATPYYYRWYAMEGTNPAWSARTNFATLAGAPTSPPPAVTAYPVIVNPSGVVVAPTNFRSANALAGTNDITGLQSNMDAHAQSIGTNVHGLGSAAQSNAVDFATASQGAKADTALQTEADTLAIVSSRGATATNSIVIRSTGPELVTNGALTTDFSGWISTTNGMYQWEWEEDKGAGGGYAWSDGAETLSQAVPLSIVAGQVYLVSLRFQSVDSSLVVSLGGRTNTIPITGPDWVTFSEYYLAADTSSLEMYGNGGVDDVSVRLVTCSLTVAERVTSGGGFYGPGAGLSDIPISSILGLGSAATNNTADFATASQGAKADTALQIENDTLASVAARGDTATNSVLVEALGSEMITNGAFVSDMSGWISTTNGMYEWGWWAGYVQSYGGTILSQETPLPIVSGQVYRVALKFSSVAQSILVSLGGITNTVGPSTPWYSYSALYRAINAASLEIDGGGAVDDVSVRPASCDLSVAGTVTSGGGFVGYGGGLYGMPWSGIVTPGPMPYYVPAPASNSAAGSNGQMAIGITGGTNFLYLYSADGGGVGTGRWMRVEGSVAW